MYTILCCFFLIYIFFVINGTLGYKMDCFPELLEPADSCCYFFYLLLLCKGGKCSSDCIIYYSRLFDLLFIKYKMYLSSLLLT